MEANNILNIDYSKLESWYDEQLARLSLDYRKQVQSFIKRIQENLDDLQAVCEAINTEIEQDQEKTSKAAAERLASKLNEVVSSEMQIPEQPFTFSGVEKFFETITHFQRSVTDIGRRWIPRLNRTYKPIIQRMDNHFKILSRNAISLYKFQVKFPWLQDAEAILSKIDDLGSEIEKLPGLKTRINSANEASKALENEITQRKSQIEQFRKQNNVVEYVETEQKIEDLHQKSEALFDLLRKPFSKFLDAMDSGKVTLPSAQTKIIQQLLEDPINFLANSDKETEEILAALDALGIIFKEGKIDYKQNKLRRIIRRIESLTKDNDITDIRQRAATYLNKMGNLESQVSFSKEKQLNQEISELTKDFGYAKERIQKYSDGLERQITRIKHIQTTIEKDISEVLPETIRILAIP